MRKLRTPKSVEDEKNLEYHRKYRDDNREKRREWNRVWMKNNREKYNAQKAIYRERAKFDAMRHYGMGKIECNICGFNNIDALCLDHINNDGAEHRRKIGIKGRGNNIGGGTYEILKREGYPEGLQVLCANCNLIKEIERKREIRLKNKFYADKIAP